MTNFSSLFINQSVKAYSLFSIYLLGFLFAFHSALPTYINSSFLNIFISEDFLGLVYTIASVFTIILLFSAPTILRRFGNYRVSLFLIIMEMVALIGLIISRTPAGLITFFIINLVAIPFIYLSWDIFLEGFSSDQATGKIRGLYLTLANLAWIFSPSIAGLILTNGDYWKIYLAALIFLIPILFILVKNLVKFKDPVYVTGSAWRTTREVWQNNNIRNVFILTFLLNFFYSWMTIYTPLYLHKYAGFSWSEIGLIFGIMLLPFVFVQFPLGKIADEKLGEKEILSVGFIIMAVSTFILFFVPINSPWWLWAFLLFITRIGAGSVEVMCDTYFFKKVDSLNVNLISFFRISRPLAYVFGPLVMSLTAIFFGMDHGQPFLILGLIILFGLYFSLNLQDTK